MQDENPIEAEQRRRQEALDQACADRYLAMLEVEHGDTFREAVKEGEEYERRKEELRAHILKTYDVGDFNQENLHGDPPALTPEQAEKLQKAAKRVADTARKHLYEQTLSPEEIREDFVPRIGGWTPGRHKPETHEGLLFELEAERAMFLGKGAPKDPDPDLQALHQELHQLHVTYQRTGDRSLLLPIADLTARYNALIKPKPRMDKPKNPNPFPRFTVD
jgi:hypothetical protein